MVCLVRKEGLELIFVFRSETLWIEILYKLRVLESVRQTLLNKGSNIFDDGSRPFCQNDLKSLLNKGSNIFDDGSRPFCQNDLKSLYYSHVMGIICRNYLMK